MASRTPTQRREERATPRHLQQYRERLQPEPTRAQRSTAPRTGAGCLGAAGPPGGRGRVAAEGPHAAAEPNLWPEVALVHAWDKNPPAQSLGALPMQQWGRQLPNGWPRCGAMSRTRARPPAVADEGPGGQ